MLKKVGITALVMAASVTGSNACGLFGQPPCPPTTIQTFGNQTFISRLGQPTTTIQTLGNQSFINTPGRLPGVCNRIGNQTFCN
jgi:hypothetical protein